MFFTANHKLNINSVLKLPEYPPLSFKKILIQNKKASVELERLYRGNFNIPSPYAEQMNE